MHCLVFLVIVIEDIFREFELCSDGEGGGVRIHLPSPPSRIRIVTRVGEAGTVTFPVEFFFKKLNPDPYFSGKKEGKGNFFLSNITVKIKNYRIHLGKISVVVM